MQYAVILWNENIRVLPCTDISQIIILLPTLFAGKLTDSDYRLILPELENLITTEGKIRILMTLNDFKGADISAIADDLEFGVKHGKDVERLAIVGDTRFSKIAADLAGSFYSNESKYFSDSEIDSAWDWLRE